MSATDVTHSEVAMIEGATAGAPYDGGSIDVGALGVAPDHSIEVPHPLVASALSRPEHAAIVCGAEIVRYRALAMRASRWARALVARGVGRGATVALDGALDADWVVGLHAIGLAGAIVAPLDPAAAGPAREDALARHGAGWGLCGGALRARGATSAGCDPSEGSAMTARLDETAAVDGPLLDRPWPLDEPRVSILTSGTTGEPRRVVLTTAQLLFSALGSAIRLGHHLDDRWLLCLPTHHVGGLSILYRTAWLGTTAVLEPRFDAAQIARHLDGGAITQVSLVPAMLARVLDARAPEPFSPALRAILVGGDRTPPVLVERARALGAPLHLTWGMSETASQIATLTPEALAAWEPGDVGPPLPFARVSRDDATGALIVDGPVAAGGHLLTADQGRVRADGHVEVEGRRDRVFISGGENVDPVRVEAALSAHPAVADALVVGIDDPALGQRTAAVLVARPDAAIPPTPALREQLSSALTRAERPSRVLWLPALPVSATGKPSRERARALLSVPMEEPS